MDRLPDDVAAALKAAKPRRKGPRFSVSTEEGRTYPLLRLWEDGFAVTETDAPRLRGYVDLLANGERMARCLIVCAEAEAGVVRYEFKRRTEDAPQTPADYARDPEAPVGLLT